MIEGTIEAGLWCDRLRGAVRDADLGSAVAEHLLGLRPGEWALCVLGRPASAFTLEQETRGRLLVDLLAELARLTGSVEQAGIWLQSPVRFLDWNPPAGWAGDDAAHMRALLLMAKSAPTPAKTAGDRAHDRDVSPDGSPF